MSPEPFSSHESALDTGPSPDKATGCDTAKAWREVATMTSNHAEPFGAWSAEEEVPAEELARRQGVKPVESVESMARPELFESDEELNEFLTDLYASRRESIA